MLKLNSDGICNRVNVERSQRKKRILEKSVKFSWGAIRQPACIVFVNKADINYSKNQCLSFADFLL